MRIPHYITNKFNPQLLKEQSNYTIRVPVILKKGSSYINIPVSCIKNMVSLATIQFCLPSLDKMLTSLKERCYADIRLVNNHVKTFRPYKGYRQYKTFIMLRKRDYRIGRYVYNKEKKIWTMGRDSRLNLSYFWTQMSIPQINKLVLMTSHIEQEYSEPVTSRFEIMDLSEK